MVVVAIIAILSMIAVPSYQGFQAKARQKEGFALLNAYYTSAQATFAELNFYPGNFVASGFAPTGQLTYRVRSQDGQDPPFGSNDNACTTTAAACTCGGGCPNFRTWGERPVGNAATGVTGPVNCAGMQTTPSTFRVVAGAIIRNNGGPDCYRLDQLKNLVMISDGLN